jgi:type II secretory pathway predicted ATPase ExeA
MDDISKYWGMKSPIFDIDDSKPQILPQRHQALMDKTRAILRNNADIVLIHGQESVGKSTAAKALYSNLSLPSQEGLFLSLVDVPSQQTWLLEKLLAYFAAEQDLTLLKKPGSDYKALWRKVSKQFDEYKNDGRKLVVIIDNADHLSEEGLLGELAKLLDLKSIIGDFVSFVLFASPDFATKITRFPKMARFVAHAEELSPISSAEFNEVWARSWRACGAASDPFNSDAKSRIVQTTDGRMGQIVTLVRSCLNAAYAQGLTAIDSKTVDQCAQKAPAVERAAPGLKIAAKVAAPRVEQPQAQPSVSQPSAPQKPIDLQSLFYDDEDDAH